MEFHETGKPASRNELEQLVALFPSSAPPELLTFYAKTNGVYEPDCYIPELHFTQLYIYEISELPRMKDIYDERISQDLMAIGSDSFGNQYCIGIHGARFGKIYFWDHEEDHVGMAQLGLPHDEELFHKNEEFISDNLDLFINAFVPDEE